MSRLIKQWTHVMKAGVATGMFFMTKCAVAANDMEVMDKLDTGLKALGEKMNELISGPVAAIVAMVLVLGMSFKMGASPLSGIIMSVAAGLVFLAVAPKLVWIIFGGG